MENGNFRQKKNRDEYQSKKDAETDLADSDGRKIRDLADTYEQRRSWPRYAYSLELLLQLKNILGCTIDELLCLEDENKPRKKRVRVIRYLD